MKTSEIKRRYRKYLQVRQDNDLYREILPINIKDNRMLHYQGKAYINFSSNDYLGLRQHSQLKQRAIEWCQTFGTGSGASRLVTGNLDVYEALETKLANWKGYEAALIMSTGYQCNASVLPALFNKKTLGAEPMIFSDKLVHASMHTGCQAAGIKQIRFRHNDMDHLEELLEKHASSDQPKFILTESVFSMDGDTAPLADLYRLRDQYSAFLIVDEAHACGVLGARGEGIADKAELVIGTFGKALGSFGAYVACTQDIKDYLVNSCAGLIYSTGLPPAVLGAIDAALDLVPQMNFEREYLIKLSGHFRDQLKHLGLSYGSSNTQIVPVRFNDPQTTLQISKKLKDAGIWTHAIRPPTVPANSSRIRFTISASHHHEDIKIIRDCFEIYAHKDVA